MILRLPRLLDPSTPGRAKNEDPDDKGEDDQRKAQRLRREENDKTAGDAGGAAHEVRGQ